MSIVIGNIEFEGPFLNAEEIRAEPGIYAILCEFNEELELIDLDESHCVRDCLDNNEHTSNLLFYAENCQGKLMAVVHYTPDLPPAGRLDLKYDLLGELSD